MIYESHPWRSALLKDADVLTRWMNKPDSDRRSFLVEQKVFLGAFTIRRLMQSFKLSTATADIPIDCTRFRCVKDVTWWDRWQWWEHYDVEHPTRHRVTIKQLVNQIIHSYIFFETEFEPGVPSLIFTSDYDRSKALLSINLTVFISLMRLVAEDEPEIMQIRWRDDLRDYELWGGSGPAPWERS